MRQTPKALLLLLLATSLLSCGAKETSKNQDAPNSVAKVEVPRFSGDSAYRFVDEQVAFGPRVPNTDAHKRCGDYLVATLKRFGASVTEQTGTTKIYDGRTMPIRNIIGSYNADKQQRVMLCAHWDSRPYADNDPNEANHRSPILGANDGGSGVGVLLEIARQLSQKNPSVGVDIVLFDLEDWGTPDFYKGAYNADTWCLGAQYWANQTRENGYKADYGILLDMVGAPGATFYKEQISMRYAPQIVDRVWQKAQSLGFDAYFVDRRGGAITDDHLYVNSIAAIPCIDIIQFDPSTSTGFGHYWHTLDDSMKNIDRNTLYAVGQTVLSMLY